MGIEADMSTQNSTHRHKDVLQKLEIIEASLSRSAPCGVDEVVHRASTSGECQYMAQIYGLLLGGLTWAEACVRLEACHPDT